MGFLRALTQIKPTVSGLAFVQTPAFLELCQRVAHEMMLVGKTWDEVDAALRHITVKELMPKRSYDADDAADFYSRNWRLIDAAWLPAVQKMKQEWQRMVADPDGFIKAFAASQAR